MKKETDPNPISHRVEHRGNAHHYAQGDVIRFDPSATTGANSDERPAHPREPKAKSRAASASGWDFPRSKK